MSTIPILTILLLIPVVFTALIGLLPAKQSRSLALVGATVTFLASLLLFVIPTTAPTGTPTRFDEKIDWMPQLGISYHVAVDGPAILLILLTTGLQLMATLYAYFQPPAANPKAFFAWLMILETAMIGAFCSVDLILFYVFFELCLVPAYFLIGMWGGRRRIPAATKFFVYTVVGSLLMLASIIGAHLLTNSIAPGTNTFDYTTIKHVLDSDQATRPVEVWLFAGFVIAFAVKAGIFPLHTWLPDTYAEAPTAAVVLLSGVMAKLGTFGLYRFGIGLFSDTAHDAGTIMMTLGVVSIIYGALIAAVQNDIKRVLAYSSISHLGFVTVGLFAFTPTAMNGAFLQMVNHGVTSGALFILAGIIESRRGTTSIKQLGGLWEQMPLFGRFFLIATLSSIALPLTNGFVGEFMILLGSYLANPVLAVLAATGVIWSAVYMLYMFQRVMYGPVDKAPVRRMTDIGRWETGILTVFVVLIFGLGVYPLPVTQMLERAVTQSLGDSSGTPISGQENVVGRHHRHRTAAVTPLTTPAPEVVH